MEETLRDTFGYEEELPNFFTGPVISNEDFVREVSSNLGNYLGGKYTPQEIEAKFRSDNENKNGYTSLNDLLMYRINETNIALHIPMVFNSTIDIRRSILDGLKKLAEVAKGLDTTKINEISGRSWIIYEHPELAQKLGFEIVKRDDDKKVAKAIMPISKLLEIYG